MKLIVTIDTEEDNWGEYSATGHSLGNIEGLPALQSLFDEFGVKPTYLVTYPVATNEKTIEIVKRLAGPGNCEIGAHCHPWNTPPFGGDDNRYNSMLSNLSPGMQYQKIKTLRDAIAVNIGIRPRSFRAGRWGYNENVGKNLCKLGFKVDTSITPLCDWSDEHGPNFMDSSQLPFTMTFHSNNGSDAGCKSRLIEIPASIGFLQHNQAWCKFAMQAVKAGFLKRTRIAGALNRLKLINLVWLSPEVSTGKEMIELAMTFKRIGYTFINMTFHSTSLLPGISPFVKDRNALDNFYNNIKVFIEFARSRGVESVVLSEAAGSLEKGDSAEETGKP